MKDLKSEMKEECHCGKNGHALNSINCPVHNPKKEALDRGMNQIIDNRAKTVTPIFNPMKDLKSKMKEEHNNQEHQYEINNLGGSFCKNCGKMLSVPDWPPYCTPPDTKQAEWEKEFESLIAGQLNAWGKVDGTKTYLIPQDAKMAIKSFIESETKRAYEKGCQDEFNAHISGNHSEISVRADERARIIGRLKAIDSVYGSVPWNNEAFSDLIKKESEV